MRAAAFAISCGVAVMLLPTVLRHALLDERLPTWLDLVFVTTWVALEAWTFTVVLRWVDRRHVALPWNLATAYGVAAVAGMIGVVGYTVLVPYFPELEDADPAGPAGAVVAGPFASLLVLGLWMMFFVTPRVVATARAAERERQELLREAERARVRATLEPHFVLNTLNAIAGLVGDEPETARTLIGDLGDLLRDVMHDATRSTHTLDDEVRWLRRYARVLEIRHRDRLEVCWRLDPDAMTSPVPVMLLQPLLENAIQHGALAPGGGGHVDVAITRVGDEVQCSIRDDGPGFGAPRPQGHGLDIVRRRLACETTGGAISITSDAGQSVVTVSLKASR